MRERRGGRLMAIGDPDRTLRPVVPPPAGPDPGEAVLEDRPNGRPTDPDELTGLTDPEVAERTATGLVNQVEDKSSRSVRDIVKANVLTRFNALLGTLFVVMMATGRFADGLFGLVLVCNLAIGIGQELRAKRTLDRLSVLHAPTCRVRRAGEVREVHIDEVVRDDLLELRTGDQVPADGEVLQADGLEVDESLLTGESEPVVAQPGQNVFSGSFVVAGHGLARATAVGAAAYARQLTAEARQFHMTTSELRASINRVLQAITWVIVIVAPLIVWSQWRVYEGGDWRRAVAGTVAALGGMVPEGLVLLTSLTMMVAAVAMVRRHVLVQELAAVEGLARVDVVCLDKTGTLTDGNIHMEAIEVLPGGPPDAADALAVLAAQPEGNATMQAIRAATADTAPGDWERSGGIPFSSARKWSATTFADHGTWVVGAPEIVGAGLEDAALDRRIEALAGQGRRVLLLMHGDEPVGSGTLPGGLQPAALCVLREQIRDDAAETLRYFESQGVTLKIISGDNPVAVAAIASEVGLDTGTPVDARDLPEDEDELARIVEERQVFGRVSPSQKRSLVKGLQAQGHVVAMTGDGVNDTLALKDADIGVAMGSGASATRAASQLVLMDDRFAQLPKVVGEGRRVINNIERVANLYLTKNMYSFVVAVTVALSGVAYPFLPRQLSLVTATTYGIPSFFLALAPFDGRHRPGFLKRVLRFSIPTGVLIGVAILGADGLANLWHATATEARTASVVAVLTAGLIVLLRLSRPLRTWKVVMVAAMALLATVAMIVPASTDLLELEPARVALAAGLVAGAAGGLAAVALTRWTDT